MNNFYDIQRVFLDLKSKTSDQREKASEELKALFKKFPELTEDVLFFLKKKNKYLNYRYFQDCKKLPIVEIQMRN